MTPRFGDCACEDKADTTSRRGLIAGRATALVAVACMVSLWPSTAWAASGDLDLGFGGDGTVITAVGPSTDLARDVDVQPDGKIVVVGMSHSGASWDFSVVRYHPDGTLDAGFGSGGRLLRGTSEYGEDAQAVVVQPDGKIVVGGFVSTGWNTNFVVFRVLSDGSPDASFGGGEVHFGWAVWNELRDLALSPDGMIVAAGEAGSGDFGAACYLGRLECAVACTADAVTPPGSTTRLAAQVSPADGYTDDLDGGTVLFDLTPEAGESTSRFAATLDATGHSETTADLAPGTYLVTARFAGDAVRSSCVAPTVRIVVRAATDVVAEPFLLTVGPEPMVHASDVAATLISDGMALPERVVHFFAGDQFLCGAVTGVEGRASCAADPLPVLVEGSYRAEFLGDEVYDASTGRGPLLRVVL